MDRLTFRSPSGSADLLNIILESALDGASNREAREVTAAIDRLFSYEETGLTPEEISDADNFLRRNWGIRLARLKEAMELIRAKDNGHLVVFPIVRKQDLKAFADGLHDYFQEASVCDPTSGIFGMRDGEKELANALMSSLQRMVTE